MEELFKARKEKLNLFKSIRNKMQDKKRIDVPDGLYTKCDSCGESILSEDLKESYYVCPKCGAHLKMRAYTRLNLLYDGGKYKELYKSIKSNDPLMFPGYKEKLMQMAKTSAALAKHHEAGLLYISYITHPTTGGVTASFAMLGDIIIGEPKALIGFAGPRVIESTIKQKLPEGFQRTEFMQDQGFIDMIVERSKMRETIIKLLKMHSRGAQ